MTVPKTPRLELLQRSPFFEGLDPEDLERFAASGSVQTFAAGERIIEEGQPARAFYLLVEGRVDIAFRPPDRRLEAADEQGAAQEPEPVPIPATAPGHLIGWSAIVEPYRYRATATALEETRVLALEREQLEAHVHEHPEFGLAFMRRVLWLVGEHLQATRMRLVYPRYQDDAAAIRALLEQSRPALSVTSALHKLPHYLENRLTLADAFETLDRLQRQGDEMERDLSALIADILEHVRLELSVFQHLQKIYELVAGAPDATDPEEVRTESCREFCRLFSETRYLVRGAQRLPERSGHIFVMNHLSNHPDNYLPNDFILTLDTHFVASMIVFRRYGVAPIRVVRKSRPDEYGHQRFYDRLGYIYVYSGHVDPADDYADAFEQQRRQAFFENAGALLRAGKNIVICPEGDSTETERSPLPFKAGAFRLAASVRPEPLVVPIAVANFDKKITRTTTAAVVHEPFRLSDVVSDTNDKAALHRFVNDDLQPRFAQWVREAAALAEDPAQPD